MTVIHYLRSLVNCIWRVLSGATLMNSPDKEKFLELYRIAHNNAVDLLAEAEILFANKKYARAYFLAFTGLEEIAKSQLAADVFTGFIKEVGDISRNRKADDLWPDERLICPL